MHSFSYQGGGLFFAGGFKGMEKLMKILAMMTVMVNHIIQQSHILDCALGFVFPAAAAMVVPMLVGVVVPVLAGMSMIITHIENSFRNNG